jgi:alkylation response protein AidB-like acyl-CoA dehydrogenase
MGECGIVTSGCSGQLHAAPLARAKSLGPLIETAADEIETGRELPDRVVEALVENGLFRLLQPRFLGGAELDPMSYVAVVEEIAGHDASTAWCLGQGNGCAMTAAYLDRETAHEIFDAPRGIIAWGPPGSGGEAVAAPGGYRLTGAWSFASGSHHATWLGAHVPIRETDGTPRRNPNGTPALRTLLFPKDRARMTDIWHVVGLRGTGSDRWAVEDLFVPERFTIARDGVTRPREAGRLYRFTASNLYASGFAGVALGIARAMLDDFVGLARDKIPRGAQKTLRDNNVIQSQTAQAEARRQSARAFLLGSLAEIWDAVEHQTELTLAQNTTIRLASTWAIHQAREVATVTYHAAGATAIFEDNPFERRFRDMHTVLQQMQGRQAHFETVGQVLLGLGAEGTMFTF